jgi:membrane protein
LLVILPPVVVSVTLLVLYLELPDTDVRVRSALVGAVVAGLAWYGMQLAHVRFQVGLARWNALYSGFGAFPVLLASVQVSWVIVLIGAQLVALHQSSPTLRVLAAGARRDFASLSALGMEVALALVGRDAPVPVRALAIEVRADLVTLRVVLDSLEARGIVSSIVSGGAKRVALAVDAASLRTSDVLDAIGRGPQMELPWREGSQTVRRALEMHRLASDTSEHNVTLAELRARAEP